ncbi:MAG: hypothetical protein COV75_01795 [Candidatus Omnitrophica bacterium CG11_big_fil_rev_8_21_14_0_20_63_9]|nr:MAG: hypothetical protein COV75_01795 [Candidatus Omnitrophica bacterium CG11_big_fil_rev_8_21_14_0_20_63_9]
MSVDFARCWIAQALSCALPPRQALGLAEWLSDQQWQHSAVDREAVRWNLSRVCGQELSGDSPRVREVFRNFGRYLYEFFTMHRAQPALTVEGREHLQAAQALGRGVIILTGHLGNWELGAVVLARMGLGISAVALTHADPRVNRLFDRQRRRCGVEVIPLGGQAAKQSLQCLKAGRLLGVLGDREFLDGGLEVSMAGARTLLPRGPALLSVRSGAPVVPTFLLREAPGAFRLRCEAPIHPARAQDTERSVEQLTTAYAGVLGRYVQRYPEQWLMFQPILRN